MSEQVLDVQSVLSILRRSRRALAGAVVVGGLLGAATVVVWPPNYTSTAQVLLPQTQSSSGTDTGPDTATEVRVATSDVVLTPAGRQVQPALSATQVRKRVTVKATTDDLLSIRATGKTADQAEALAQAVARAEVDYQAEAASSLSSAQRESLKQRGNTLKNQLDKVTNEIATTKKRMNGESPVTSDWHADATALAQLTAQQTQITLQVDNVQQKVSVGTSGTATVVDGASPAKRSALWLRYTLSALLGALLLGVVFGIGLIVRGRRDRRLRTRDEIADAIGSAVVGSVRSRPARAAAGWASLLEAYQPSVMDAWTLRQVLDHVGVADAARNVREGEIVRGKAITLITLSDDDRALAVGPQLASYAASIGLHARLVMTQGHESSAPLWTACSSYAREQEIRPGLRAGGRRRKSGDHVAVEMVVLDRRNPQFMKLDHTAITLLAVSASSASAEDLARAAVAAYEAGGRISGVIVADPDSLDRTSGRMLLQQRSEQASLPVRMTGLGAANDGTQGRGGR